MAKDVTSPKAEAAGLLTAIVEEFEDELEASPTLGEVLEIVGVSVPSTELTAGILAPVQFAATLADGKSYRSALDSRVGELNDAAFVHASALVIELLSDSDVGADREVGADDLAESLLGLLRRMDTAFADIWSGKVARLDVVGPSRTVRAKIGDVVAIPARQGGFHLASILVRNTFGTGIGVWRDVRSAPRFNALEEPVPEKVLYTEDVSIKNGHWPVVGHSKSALSRFPSDPEIYHTPDSFTGFGPRIGEFGSAEKPDGTMRDVSREEASRLGLLDGSYRQVYLSAEVPDVLARDSEAS